VPGARILDVGCGINKYPGAIGLDRNARTRADVLADLDRPPYPFADGSFDEVRATHVIEHVADVMAFVEECWRLLRPGGRLHIATPHYTDFSSFCDPTHRWHLNSYSLRYFGADDAGYGYYTHARFRENFVRVKLLSIWRLVGLEFLVNRFERFRRFWEHYLCFVVRGKVIEWELAAVKETNDGDTGAA
jgi:SAM-dependent methyltransferase